MENQKVNLDPQVQSSQIAPVQKSMKAKKSIKCLESPDLESPFIVGKGDVTPRIRIVNKL